MIRNVTALTGAGEQIDGASIVLQDGKIAAIDALTRNPSPVHKHKPAN